MKKERVRVSKRLVECNQCGKEYEVYEEVPDEGFGYAAKILTCQKTREFFYYTGEDEAYLGPVGTRMIELNEKENRLIRRRLPAGSIFPDCSVEDYEWKTLPEDTFIEAYRLYGDT